MPETITVTITIPQGARILCPKAVGWHTLPRAIRVQATPYGMHHYKFTKWVDNTPVEYVVNTKYLQTRF